MQIVINPYQNKLTNPVPQVSRDREQPAAPVTDASLLSGATVEDTPRKMSLAARAGLVGTMVAAAVGGGLLSVSATSLPPLDVNDPLAQVKVVPARAPMAAEQPSQDIHIISHVDATEEIIEPIAAADLTQLDHAKQLGGSHVTADISMDRKAVDPAIKIVEGAMAGTAMLAPLVGGLYLAKKSNKGYLKVGFFLAGTVASATLCNQFGMMRETLAPFVSAQAAMQGGQTRWSGNRTYTLKGDGHPTAATSSTETGNDDAKAIGGFLGERLKAYPNGTSVVHLMGHGLGYRYSSGLPFSEYQSVLAQTVAEGGRPIDVLVVESCLEGNFEAMNGSYPFARYAVVSEESVTAGAIGNMLENTMQSVSGKNVTPRELGTAMIAAADSQEQSPRIETLALVDLQQMPSLSGAVDRLGATLTQEVQAGRSGTIKSVIADTPIYPRYDPEGHAVSSQFKVGDLRGFATRIQVAYTKGSGASTPQAAQVRQAAADVLSAMDKAVVKLHTTGDYKEAGGLSIQLPDPSVAGIEKLRSFKSLGLTPYSHSGAPSNWETFVQTMGTQSDPLRPPVTP